MYPPRSNTTVSIFFSNAFFAIAVPTSLAASLFAYFVLMSLSKVEQLTNVFPATSSMICTYKFVLLLYMHNLGLSAVPDIFLLTLKCLLVLYHFFISPFASFYFAYCNPKIIKFLILQISMLRIIKMLSFVLMPIFIYLFYLLYV